jgi:hypothetical protein
MLSWTERIELFFTPLYRPKNKQKKIGYFKKLQMHRLAEAERLIKDRMNYPGSWKFK